jgi:hypothetical protein
MAKGSKNEFNYDFSFHEDYLLKELIKFSPTLYDHYKEFHGLFCVTREDVAQYIIKAQHFVVLDAHKEIARIMFGWQLNHLAYVVADVFKDGKDKFDVYKEDLRSLNQNIEQMIKRADPELRLVIQTCYLDSLLSTLEEDQPELDRLFSYLGVNCLKLLSAFKDYKSMVYFYTKKDKLNVLNSINWEISKRPSPMVDYAIIVVEKFIYNKNNELSEEVMQARRTLSVLKKNRDDVYKSSH